MCELQRIFDNMLMIKLICAIFVIGEINCQKNVCDKDCIADVLINKNNLSAAKDSDTDHNITVLSSVFDKLITYDEWNQVINENLTCDPEKLPHYVVPEISSHERDFVNVLSRKYLKLQPPFELSHVAGVSNQCRQHSNKFVEALKKFELWALKMHDATAKLPSGILNGNVNNFGDFDLCFNAESPSDEFQGKYCLAYLQPSVTKPLKFTNYLRKLMQSHEAFKSNFDDPGHRVPRYSTINWAVCVPSTCSQNDVELTISHYVNTFTNGTGFSFEIRVEEEMCQVKDKNWMENLDRGTRIAIAFCLLLLMTIGASTIYEACDHEENKSELFTSFSLIRNTRALFSLSRSSGDIKTAHAIRFFNAVMLVLSHKCMAIFFDPYSNRTMMTDFLGKPWTVLARAASLYTDPFLMLSGMLTAYSLIGKLKRNGRFNLAREYAGRYLRIMPPLAFLIIFCTFILPLLGNGPQWNLVVTHHAGICKQHWWRNLLFIHNWFGFSNMCLTHTHHVGIDTELFAVAPFLILVLWKWPKKGMKLIIGLATLSTIARYYVTYTYDLSNYVFFGTSVKQLFETADRMYIMPPHRFTVYSMGIGLGYILRMCKDFRFTKSQLKIGWYLSIASFLLAFFGPAPMGDIDYKFNSTHAAHYAAFAPIAWCLFFGWIILVSQLGHKNKFIELLEWRGFLVCTRLSYSLYLTQFPIFFFNVGMVRTPIQYSFFKVILNIGEFLCITLVTIVLTLFVELPFNNVKTLLLEGRRNNKISKQHLDVNSNSKEKEL